ncbi:unnamed protein product [Phytophthora fragariaefolia]|uniref:Unnamed protein product n=1 Tax=Phytophthora fragariaefolia TaxID=1490495 RepID=A0A9W7D514_9STRA|nr:unnamed protein product [Phytophthora fragariaefolia]
MYATLGIEPDDSSDDDFVVDVYDEEEEDEERLSTDESEEGVILPTGNALMFCYIAEFSSLTHDVTCFNICSTQTSKREQDEPPEKPAAQKNNRSRNPRCNVHLNVSPEQPRPRKKRAVVAKETDQLSVLDPENDSDSCSASFTLYNPRKCASKHLQEMQSMAPVRDVLVNVVPPLSTGQVIKTWDDFETQFGIYKRKHHVNFRVRSSESTERYNRCE